MSDLYAKLQDMCNKQIPLAASCCIFSRLRRLPSKPRTAATVSRPHSEPTRSHQGSRNPTESTTSSPNQPCVHRLHIDPSILPC